MIPRIRSLTLQNIDARIAENYELNKLVLNPSNIHVWSIGYTEHFHELFKNFRFLISQSEFDKAKRLHWANHFKRYLTGRVILRILLARYLNLSPSKILFNSNNGKLFLHGSPLKFNLSYSASHIFMSFGFCDTGIDIESIKSDFNTRDILHACFALEEIKNIDLDAKNPHERFFLQWTRKEALLKYTGQGIIDDLTVIPSLDGLHEMAGSKLKINSDINLISFKPSEKLVGSLAYPADITNVEFFKWKS